MYIHIFIIVIIIFIIIVIIISIIIVTTRSFGAAPDRQRDARSWAQVIQTMIVCM